MRRKSTEAEVPLEVHLGEFWNERKAELGAMRRVDLEKALVSAGVIKEDEREMGFSLKWLRKRLAYNDIARFYLDRGHGVPQATAEAAKRLDDPKNRGKMQPWEVDFFLDARRAERSEMETKRLLKRGTEDED